MVIDHRQLLRLTVIRFNPAAQQFVVERMGCTASISSRGVMLAPP